MPTKVELQMKMAERLRSKAKERYKGARPETIEMAAQTAEEGPMMAWLRSPGFQSTAKALEARIPRLRGYRQKDESPGHGFLRALWQIGDPSQDFATKQELGLPSNATRDDIFEAVLKGAPEVASNVTELKEILGAVQTAGTIDGVADRLFARDAGMEGLKAAGGKIPGAVPAREQKEMGEFARFRDDRRATLEKAMRAQAEAARAAAPLMEQRKARLQPSSELKMDIALATAALEGRRPEIDLTAPGAQQYLKQAGFGQEELDRIRARDDLEWVEAKIEETQLQQQQQEAHEAAMAETPEEAAGMAGDGGSDG